MVSGDLEWLSDSASLEMVQQKIKSLPSHNARSGYRWMGTLKNCGLPCLGHVKSLM